MSQLSQSQPLIVLTIGTPGAGKSFFARQFADTFRAPLVSFDLLRYELFPKPTYSKQEVSFLARMASHQIVELLKTGRTFIVDGGHNNSAVRQELERIAKKSGYKILVVWVQTDTTTAKSRSMRRSEKRAGDELNTSLTEEIFEQQSSEFHSPLRHEAFVVISGKHTYPTQARVVLRKMVNPSETPLPPPPRPASPSPRPGRSPIRVS